MTIWLTWVGAGAGTAWAAPHDPYDFAALAPTLSTGLQIDVNTSSSPPTLSYNGGATTYSGVIDGDGHAVFTFGSIDVTRIEVTGSRAFVLLAQTTFRLDGLVQTQASGATAGAGGSPGRAGSGGAGSGTGGGGFGDTGGGGGGFGAVGGDVGAGSGYGGAAYGDLRVQLDGGSGGGRANDTGSGGNNGDGGGGGGAIELGAGGAFTFTTGADVRANGGNGADGSEDGGGGGSGGGVLVHGKAGSSCVNGTLRVKGGNGGGGNNDDGGGGGAGGRAEIVGFAQGSCSYVIGGGLGGYSDTGGSDLDGLDGPNGVFRAGDVDLDGDGTLFSADCDDADPAREPGNPETTADGVDSNCDRQERCWADADNDGARDAAATVASADLDCDDAGEAWTADPIDCDDGNAAIHPGATEVVGDGVDSDCDTQERCYVDADDDGARTTATLASVDLDCTDAGEGRPADPIDCADTDPARSPLVAEVAGDDVDQNCDGSALCYTDADDDGARLTTTVASVDADCADANEGRTADPIDCADTNAGRSPLLAEIAGDNVDQDCDNREECYVDGDDDGARTAATATSTDADCNDATEARAGDPLDCADNDPTRHPGASEVVGDGIDQDCDGGERCYVDADDDGARVTSEVASADADCADAGESPSSDPLDCDDTRAGVRPGGAEVQCNGLDDDCAAGTLDERDRDGDGETECTDCDDLDGGRAHGLPETCDGTDEDCDKAVDDGLPTTTFYEDRDGDGFGDGGLPFDSCLAAPPPGAAADGTDCDDSLDTVFPGSPEVACNGSDDDCDVATPDGADLDGDGFSGCSTDCDDGDPTVHPGAVEVCDGVDGDCDPTTPECPDSGDTGATGETATPPTGETGTTVPETGTSAPTGDTGAPTDTVAKPPPDPGCGCGTAPGGPGLGALLALTALARRRR